jgi:hypothetical protein
MKIIIELDDSIDYETATEMVETWEQEPWARNVYIEQSKCHSCTDKGKCGGNDPTETP